jgi:chitin synthase
MINRTLSSIASSNYPDLQKLLFIVCDGNVTGQNSKKPTPNIVLELLGNNGMGASYAKYKSTGAGSKSPNQARVYCGYYNGIAAKIPYIVVVKEGNSWEGMQPGHRGKRDSLLIAMNLFHKVGLQNPVMNPLEYELFQRMAGELHLTPSSYRYMMTIDADVELRRDSMFEMIKSFKNEKVIAVGGQVCVQNRWASALTVLQVHDYYFRNNIQKAYESTVGSITYIPDCFAAYRIKFADGRPAITDPCLLSDFSDCSADTLHTRNMITFGEDRYLTTLIHKYFPSNRLVYARDAVCYMNVPSDLAVLTSQRRRWINSAFHNWFGILGLPRNCHFSTMVLKWRALVNIFATASAPISLATYYFVIFCASLWPDYSVALLASALLPSFYLLMLVLKGDLGQVFWSLVYLVFGLPLFHFVFPLYAFWCMDCLSPGVPRRPRATHDDHTTWDTTDGLDEMRQGHAQEEIELRPLSEWLTK